MLYTVIYIVRPHPYHDLSSYNILSSHGRTRTPDTGPVYLVREASLCDIVPLIRPLERELVGGEPEIAVFDAHAVRPLDIRTPDEGHDFDVGSRYDAPVRGVRAGCVKTVQHSRVRERGDGGVEIGDGVLLRGAHVHAAVVVGREAFEIAADLADELDCVEDLGVR